MIDRRRIHRLSLMYKIIHKQTPQYLFNIVEPYININNTHQYNTRQSNFFSKPLCRTNSYLNSHFPSTMDEWNKLNNETANCSSLKSFKNILESAVIDQQNTISDNFKYCTPRKINMILTQIRNNMSDLNSDKYSDHLINNPSCSCGYPCENKVHFFFSCPNFTAIRHHIVEIHNQLGFIHTDLLTNGSCLLSDEQNLFIFDQVKKFIEESSRL